MTVLVKPMDVHNHVNLSPISGVNVFASWIAILHERRRVNHSIKAGENGTWRGVEGDGGRGWGGLKVVCVSVL